MIWQPKTGQLVKINYKDKSMPLQGKDCQVEAVGSGPGPKNVLVIIFNRAPRFEYGWRLEVVPRGNLITTIL